MAATAQPGCAIVLATSLALIEQFRKSLVPSAIPQDAQDEHNTSPLLLFKAAAESLKHTTTKLSLLSITPPFTGSAVVSLLKPLNDSILPSLVTAALLVTSNIFPESFAAEANRIAESILIELKLLLELVEKRAKDGKPKSGLGKDEKQAITEATGRVWEHCDGVIKFSTDGVPGFTVRKAEQWLGLMKDAVQELQEWDPEEDVDEDIFGDVGSDEDDPSTNTDKEKDQDQVTIAAGVKDQALKVLSRIPQSIHVVIKQRLAKIPTEMTSGEKNISSEHKRTLDNVIKDTRHISECIDESAEAMYMGDPELCLKKAGEARAITIGVIESVLSPWQLAAAESESTEEDTFIKRALVWIQQVDTSLSSNGNSG